MKTKTHGKQIRARKLLEDRGARPVVGERLWAVGHLEEEVEKSIASTWHPTWHLLALSGLLPLAGEIPAPLVTWGYSVCAPWDLNPEPAD